MLDLRPALDHADPRRFLECVHDPCLGMPGPEAQEHRLGRIEQADQRRRRGVEPAGRATVHAERGPGPNESGERVGHFLRMPERRGRMVWSRATPSRCTSVGLREQRP